MYDHEIDPSGDVIISLRPSKAPFAEWKSQPAIDNLAWTSENWGSIGKKDKKKGKRAQKEELTPFVFEPEPKPEPEASVRFLVSSRHLTLASPMIKAMLSTSSGWSEAQKDGDGLYNIGAEDWDETAFSIVLNVLHCQYRKVPAIVALEMLAKIAAIVDYYQVHEAMVLVSRTWLAALKLVRELPTELNRDLCLWLTVASVFTDTHVFKSLTRVAILQGWRGMEFPVGLPIPSGVISEYMYHGRVCPPFSPWLTVHLGRISKVRNSSVEVITSGLKSLREDYLEGREGCSFECRAIHHGALTINMRQLKIDDRIIMEGTTIVELVKRLKEMQSPQWSQCVNGYSGSRNRHSCPIKGTQARPTAFDLDKMDDVNSGSCNSSMGTLNGFAAQLVQSVKHSLVGLELSDFSEVYGNENMLF